ncbi:ankyrin repeat and KH domain-containing protein mask-like [Drosophila nasuta]|uniref:ankyrin repeat and KH domain-containing protein mask-like n=1 Tax=Drosophila nasuta TaxID=42062 RepID=UPI00295F57BA|nr:ankyrin repeat and KH domain-containing protein mask-like [Drosophila nasuta]
MAIGQRTRVLSSPLLSCVVVSFVRKLGAEAGIDDIQESDPDSCPHDEGEVREDEDETEEDSEDSDKSEGDDEEEEIDVLQDNDADDEDTDDEDDDEDAPEVKNLLHEHNNKRSSNLTALLEAAANVKAPVA